MAGATPENLHLLSNEPWVTVRDGYPVVGRCLAGEREIMGPVGHSL